MNSIFIPLAWWFLYRGFYRCFNRRRDAMLAAACGIALFTVGITEFLSLFTQLRFYPVLILWMLAAAASGAFWIGVDRQTFERPRASISFDRHVVVILLAMVGIAVGVGAAAVFAPPNTWDSMTYHMARVANWQQHRTVAHYQTANLRQLYLAPLSEFFILQLQVLTGTDRLANLVQYFAMLGSAIGVSAIAGTLRATTRGQALAALFAMALPIGLLEASSTQSDYVAAFWVVCAINAGLSLTLHPDATTRPMLLMFVAAVAIALLSKTTTVLFLAPFVGWILAASCRHSFRVAITRAVAIALVALLLNAGHLHRNQAAFGKVLGPDSETIAYKNAIHTPGAIVSNILRDTCMNLGYRGTGWMVPIAQKIIPKISGLDANDPRITWLDSKFNFYFSKSEDDAGNPLHLLLGAVAILMMLARFKSNPPAGVYAICLLTGGLLFCFELKWQPWITRLQLPLFVITAPLIGVAVDRIKFRFAGVTAAVLLLVSTQPYFAHGFPRKLMGPGNVISTPRLDQYFQGRSNITADFENAGVIMRQMNPKSVGLCCGGDDWEYAVRILLPSGVEIVHLSVTNESKNCAGEDHHRPDELVLLDSAKPPADLIGYKPMYKSADITVLVAAK